jgi:hypothetical protein
MTERLRLRRVQKLDQVGPIGRYATASFPDAVS